MLPEKQSKCAQKSTTLSNPPPHPSRKEKNKFPQKIETPTIRKNINICEVKKCDNNYRGSCKKLSGGRGKTIYTPPPATYGERDPPHGENGLYVERKNFPHRKITPIRETPPPTWNLFIHAATPQASAYSPPPCLRRS